MSDGPRPQVLALLHAARADPEDDTPRLILADWLEERDDPRGTFIRLQCQLAALSPTDPRRQSLQHQADDLRTRHEADWLGDLLDQGERTYERGLLRLTMSKFRFASSPIQGLVGSETWAWVESLRLQGGLSGKLARFLDSPLVETLAVLDLSGNGLGSAQARQLAQIPRLAGLGELNLNENSLGALGAQWLANCPGLADLTSLGLSGNVIGDSGLSALLDSPHLNRLRKIDLEGCLLGVEGMRRLNRSAWLPRLRHLNLRYNDLRPEGIMALADGVGTGSLEHLDLFGCRCEDAGVAALATSGLARRLRWLDLSRNRLSTHGLEALAASPAMSQLEELRLFGNQMVDVGLSGLLTLASLDRLRRLDLGHNLLTAEGMTALAAADRLCLEALDLDYNPIGDEGLDTLLRSTVLTSVRELGLNACSLTSLATTRLVEAELPNLRTLDLRNNGKPGGPQAHALRERLGDGLQL